MAELRWKKLKQLRMFDKPFQNHDLESSGFDKAGAFLEPNKAR